MQGLLGDQRESIVTWLTSYNYNKLPSIACIWLNFFIHTCKMQCMYKTKPLCFYNLMASKTMFKAVQNGTASRDCTTSEVSLMQFI